jgi:hypothetical protein
MFVDGSYRSSAKAARPCGVAWYMAAACCICVRYTAKCWRNAAWLLTFAAPVDDDAVSDNTAARTTASRNPPSRRYPLRPLWVETCTFSPL